jgi:hypothetical protein
MQPGTAHPPVAFARAPAVATDGSPPAVLPGEHFAAALLFFVAGAASLAWIAPDVTAGAFYLPRVAAVVHLFTLGWIMLSIFGALCQFLPVAVGRAVRWPVLAHVSFALQAAGAALLVCGLVSGHRALLFAGAGALTGAFVSFAANLGATLLAVKARSLTWWALAGASVFLVATPAYGVALAANLHDGALGGARFEVVAAHAHVALVGVVLLVVVGVAHRLLPMFLLSHGASERPAWVAVGLLFASAAVLAVPVGGGARYVASGVLAAGGVVAFLAQAAMFFRARVRRAIDPGMRLAAAGLVGLAASVLLAPFALTRGLADPHLLTTYFVVLLGALTMFVAGHAYKIVPFLVWYHRFGPLVGTRKVPRVADLYSERVAALDGALLVAGWVGLALSTYAGAPALARVSALALAAGAALEAVVLVRVARRRPA